MSRIDTYNMKNDAQILFKKYDIQTSEEVKGADGKMKTQKIKDGADNKIDVHEFKNALDSIYKSKTRNSQVNPDIYDTWINASIIRETITSEEIFMYKLLKALDNLMILLSSTEKTISNELCL